MPLLHDLIPITTDDGVKGLIIDIPGTPVVHYKIHFRAGYHNVLPSIIPQTAHVLEHLLYGWVDNEKYPTKKQFLDDVYKNGAYANATTYYAGSWHWGDNTIDEWKRVLELRKLAITHPLFSGDALMAEKGNAEDELRSNIGNFERLASEASRQNLGFVSETSQQKKDSIKGIKLAEITALYERAYTRSNMRFIIAGDLKGQVESVRKAFGHWELPAGKMLDFPIVTLRKGGAINFTQVADIPNIYFVATFAVGRQLEEHETRALELLNSRLFNNQNSLIFEEARRRGICYRMAARVDQDVPGVTLWTIAFPIAPQNMKEMLGLLVNGFQDLLKHGMPKKELETGLRQDKGRFIQKGQTASSLTDLYFDRFVLAGDVSNYSTADPYERVSPALIDTLVREFLLSGAWTVTGVGKIEAGEFESLAGELIDLLKAAKL